MNDVTAKLIVYLLALIPVIILITIIYIALKF